MSRITDHLTCVGASAMELGAFGPFLFFLKAASGSTSCSRRSRARGSRTATCASAASARICRDDFADDLTHTLDQIEKVMVEVEAHAQRQQDLPRSHGRHRRDDEGRRDRHRLRRSDRARVRRRLRRPQGLPVLDLSRARVRRARRHHRRLPRSLPRADRGAQAVRSRMLRQCLKQIPDGPIDGRRSARARCRRSRTRTTRSSR